MLFKIVIANNLSFSTSENEPVTDKLLNLAVLYIVPNDFIIIILFIY
jgi:hypothetical protein